MKKKTRSKNKENKKNIKERKGKIKTGQTGSIKKTEKIQFNIIKDAFKTKFADFKGKLRVIGVYLRAVKRLFLTYLPQISRFFSAKSSKRWFKILVAGFFILLIIVATATAAQKYNSINEAHRELGQRYETNEQIKKIEEQINYWEKVVKQRNGYRDGYLELAILNYKLGRILTTKEYLERAKELDPNNEMVEKLEKIIR